MNEPVNVFPSEYYQDFERTQETSKPHAPILFIPGVCGSKLIAKNRKTGNTDYAWINTSFLPVSIPQKLAQYLWGYNDKDLNFKSYVDDYVEIAPIPGTKGCDKLLDIGILDTKILENVNIGKYFGPFMQYLEKQYFYKIGVDLFAFSYDWRESPANNTIQQELSELIKQIRKSTGQKVVIIAHSMGGVVTECYMKNNPNFTDHIEKFIAMGVPFDGCGGYSLEAMLLGYTLRLPMPKCAAKGIEASGGCAACLHIRVNGKSPAVPCVYVKKLSHPDSQQPSTFEKIKDDITSVLSRSSGSEELETLSFDASVYNDDVPDVCFCIAKHLFEERGIAFPDALQIYKKLQTGCRKGAIIINGESVKRLQESVIMPEQVIEQNFIKCTEDDLSRQDYQWECYSVWKDYPGIDREYEFENKYMKFENSVQFSKQMFYYIEHGISNVQYDNLHIKLRDYAQALEYHKEFEQPEPVPEYLLKPESVSSCFIENDLRPVPWSSLEERIEFPENSFFELMKKMHPSNTLEGMMYHVDQRIYEQLVNVRKRPICVPPGSGFKFYSLSGTGINTPLHLVYNKPVFEYSELQNQKPEYVNVDGDGTVFLTGALGDEFDDEISTRVIINGLGHFPMITSEKSWGVICKWLLE